MNNINIKNGTRNKVVHIASHKSSSSMLLRLFSVVFPCIRKKLIRSDDEICYLYINQSINPVFTLRMVAYYGKTNKNELSKDTTEDTHF